jgi:chorismate mutase/prephenate dehydratase
VREHLMSQSGRLEDIEQVASHPNALGQCARWLEARLPGVPTLDAASTAKAAELAASKPTVAAIGSEVAAETYGLCVIESGIEDSRRNTTRFLIIGSEAPAASGDDLTAAVFTVRKDQSGALYHLLEPFARHGVNLSSIQSRPMKGKPWEYLFFVDMEGHVSEERVTKALAAAADAAHSSKVLGSFPRASQPRRGSEGL